MYMTSTFSMYYQDAALACLMWHAFGGASDKSIILNQCMIVSDNYATLMQKS